MQFGGKIAVYEKSDEKSQIDHNKEGTEPEVNDQKMSILWNTIHIRQSGPHNDVTTPLIFFCFPPPWLLGTHLAAQEDLNLRSRSVQSCKKAVKTGKKRLLWGEKLHFLKHRISSDLTRLQIVFCSRNRSSARFLQPNLFFFSFHSWKSFTKQNRC